MRKTLTALLVLAVLAGCATSSDRTDQWIAMEQARQGRVEVLAARCETDLCRYVVAQEINQALPMPQQRGYHPIWNIVSTALQVGIPAYANVASVNAWGDIVQGVGTTIAGIDRADNSITVGGNLGDTDNSVNVGGNLGDTDNSTSVAGNFGDTDNSTTVGGNQGDTRRDTRTGDDRIGDNVGGDQFGGDYRQGDDVRDGCIGDSCRSTSDGPIDNSNPGDDNNDNSDNSDNSGGNP